MRLQKLLEHREKNRKNKIEVKLVCKECGSEYIITIGDICWYHEMGYLTPNLCKSCREQKKIDNRNRIKRSRFRKDLNTNQRTDNIEKREVYNNGEQK